MEIKEVHDGWEGWRLVTVAAAFDGQRMLYLDAAGLSWLGADPCRERHAALAKANAEIAERLEEAKVRRALAETRAAKTEQENSALTKENTELTIALRVAEKAAGRARAAAALAAEGPLWGRTHEGLTVGQWVDLAKQRAREILELREQIDDLRRRNAGYIGAAQEISESACPHLPVLPLAVGLDSEERVELSEKGKALVAKLPKRRLVTLTAPDDRDVFEVTVRRGSRQEEIYRLSGYREALEDPEEAAALLEWLDTPESVEEHLAKGNIEKAAELIWEALRPNDPPGQPEDAERGAEELAERLMAKAGRPADNPCKSWKQAAEGWRKRAEGAEIELSRLRTGQPEPPLGCLAGSQAEGELASAIGGEAPRLFTPTELLAGVALWQWRVRAEKAEEYGQGLSADLAQLQEQNEKLAQELAECRGRLAQEERDRLADRIKANH